MRRHERVYEALQAVGGVEDSWSVVCLDTLFRPEHRPNLEAYVEAQNLERHQAMQLAVILQKSEDGLFIFQEEQDFLQRLQEGGMVRS